MMSGVEYEGYCFVESFNMDCKKAWAYNLYPALMMDCPFDGLRFGELMFAVYAHGQVEAVKSPAVPGAITTDTQSLIREFVSKQPTLPDNVRINCDKKGVLKFSLNVTQNTWNKLDESSYIQINIYYENFEPEKGQDWKDLSKTLLSAKNQQAFRDPFPLQIKKLDQDRMEKLYPKADLKKYSKTRCEEGEDYLRNILVVVKFSRSCCRTEGLWITSQQIMGETILADNVLSDFAIQAGGKTFPCHRIYLAGRSSVLARLLQSKVKEVETGIISMEDISAEGVEGFLKYLYTGSLVGPMADLSLALELLRAGHKYEVNDLEVLCKKILDSAEINTFDAATAFEMYQFSGQVEGCHNLRAKSIRLLKENAVKFKETGEIASLLEAIQSASDRKAFNDWMCDGLQFA